MVWPAQHQEHVNQPCSEIHAHSHDPPHNPLLLGQRTVGVFRIQRTEPQLIPKFLHLSQSGLLGVVRQVQNDHILIVIGGKSWLTNIISPWWKSGCIASFLMRSANTGGPDTSVSIIECASFSTGPPLSRVSWSILLQASNGTFQYWTVSVAGFELSGYWWDVAPFE